MGTKVPPAHPGQQQSEQGRGSSRWLLVSAHNRALGAGGSKKQAPSHRLPLSTGPQVETRWVCPQELAPDHEHRVARVPVGGSPQFSNPTSLMDISGFICSLWKRNEKTKGRCEQAHPGPTF